MNEEEKFDELLSSKLSERDFPFDELNWDEAERLIIKQQRWRKMVPFFLTFSAGLLVGIAIFLPFMLSKPSVSTTAVATVSGTSQSVDKKSSSQVSANEMLQSAGNNNIQNKEGSSSLVKSNSVKANTSTVIAKEHPEQSVLAAAIRSHRKHLNNKSTLVASIAEPKHKDVYTKTTQSNSTEEIKSVNTTSTKKEDVSETKNTSNNNTKTDNSSVANTTTTNVVKTENTVASTTVTTTNTSPTNTESSKSNTSTSSIPPDNKIATKPKADSSKVDAPPLPLPPIIPAMDNAKEYSANILSAFAGANYSLGWNDNEEKEANGITPLAGFSFAHYFTEKLAAAIGIGFTEIDQLNNSYTSSYVNYDFGATTTFTSLTPQKVYYIAFPLKLEYNLDTKDKLSLGADYLLMLTTSSTLSTYKQNYFTEIPGTSSIQNGYTQGFSNGDLQLSIGYTRMVTNRLGVSLEYYHDLGYIENNTIAALNQNGKNNDFRFIFSYQIIK